MTILFGSQSGTAEAFAFELQKEARHANFNARVVDLEDYDHETELPNEKFVLFLLATFGEGEPTDSAVSFYEWIMDEDREDDLCKGVEFACFALGNKQYEFYCAIGRRVVKRMKEIGASELLSHGEGDDDGSLDDDYAEWKQQMWSVVKAHYLDPEELNKSNEAETSFDASYEIEFIQGDADKEESKTPPVSFDAKHKGVFAPVKVSKELRQDPSTGSTLHIEYDISGTDLTYLTADNLGVHCRNPPKLVHKLAKRLNYDLKARFVLKPKTQGRKTAFSKPMTVQDALLWHVDVSALPGRSVLDTLKLYATDPDDKEKLIKWTTDDKQAFNEDKKNLLEVLEAVPSVNPPLHELIEFLPVLQPRFYTISSSSVEDSSIVSATVKVTRDELPRGRFHEGVCSTYMSQGKEGGAVVPIFVRSSTFRPTWSLTNDTDKENAPHPMIMVGPGTGIAPFRAFAREAKHRHDNGDKLGRMMLFFGCQKRDRDYLYADELQSAADEGILDLKVAFSREDPTKKVYVQNLIEECGDDVWDLMYNQHGHFYVCGGTSMGKNVRDVLCKLAMEKAKMSDKEASEFLHMLQENGRYIQELWG